MLDSYNALLLKHIKSKKAKKKASESLNEKECEIYVLKKSSEEKRSSINCQQLDLNKRNNVIQKRYSNLLKKLITNHENVKKLKVLMKALILGKVTQLFVIPYPSRG